MPQRKHKPKEIVAKLRQVDLLLSEGRPIAEAIRAISVTPFTYYRWRKEFGGLKSAQVKRLKDLENENPIGGRPRLRSSSPCRWQLFLSSDRSSACRCRFCF